MYMLLKLLKIFVGFERKSCSPGFLDLLLYKLHARFARPRVFGKEVQ